MSEVHIGWDSFAADTRKLAAGLPWNAWGAIVCITRGGLIPAGIIAHERSVRLIDTLCVATYKDRKQGEPLILKAPNDYAVRLGSNLLVIDDLVDSGATVKRVKAILPQAYYAAVYAKPRGQPDLNMWARPMLQNEWLVFPWEKAEREDG